MLSFPILCDHVVVALTPHAMFVHVLNQAHDQSVDNGQCLNKPQTQTLVRDGRTCLYAPVNVIRDVQLEDEISQTRWSSYMMLIHDDHV